MRTWISGGTTVMKESFIDDFVDINKSVTLEFQNINQKIANLDMKDQYPKANNLNEQQEQWKEANNSTKINRNSTRKYQAIASRNKFRPIYTEPLELTEDDVHTIDLQINNLATQNTQRSFPAINKYQDRDLFHHQIKDSATSIVRLATQISVKLRNVTEKRILLEPL